MIPKPVAGVGSGVPETSSTAATITASVIAVPRSGSSRMSKEKSASSAPTGRHRSASVCGGCLFARCAAIQTTTASLASSDGWKTAGPKLIQRRAPLIGCAIASTATQPPIAISTRPGEMSFSRR